MVDIEALRHSDYCSQQDGNTDADLHHAQHRESLPVQTMDTKKTKSVAHMGMNVSY